MLLKKLRNLEYENDDIVLAQAGSLCRQVWWAWPTVFSVMMAGVAVPQYY